MRAVPLPLLLCAALQGTMASVTPCEACSNAGSCGACLVLVAASRCPNRTVAAELPKCTTAAALPFEELCEGNGDCGTDNFADSCSGFFEVYRRVECALVPPSPPSPPLPPPSPPSPPSPP